MAQKVLTFQISVKTEIDEATWFKMLKELLPTAEVGVKTSNFDWNQEVVIDKSSDGLSNIVSELYDKLIAEMSRFTDWEYKFINDMYRKAEESETYSQKQEAWILKLKEKYLD